MTGQVVLTGHLGGVGEAICDELVDAGYRVIGIDAAGEPSSAQSQIVCDLSSLVHDSGVNYLRDQLKVSSTDDPLVALINNAAVQQIGKIEDISRQSFIDSFIINAYAPIALARVLLKQLKQSHGTILNISSIHAEQTKPGFAPYSVSKSALSGVTRALAVELGASVRVLEIRPAAISTPMLEAGFGEQPSLRRQLDDFHPSGRIGQPHEIASLARQLIESDSQFLNGAVLNLDGGISHRLHDPV